MHPYLSYPEGYERLSKKLMPLFPAALRRMMMRLLVRILSEG